MSSSNEREKFKPLDIDSPDVARARSVKKLSGGDDEDSNKRVLSNLKKMARFIVCVLCMLWLM